MNNFVLIFLQCAILQNLEKIGYLWEGGINKVASYLYFESTCGKKKYYCNNLFLLYTNFRSSLVQYYSIGHNNQTYFRVGRVLKCASQLSTQCLSSCWSTGCQPWPCTRMIWEALKIPVLGPTSVQLYKNLHRWLHRWPRHQCFLNLLWWF